MDTHTLKSRWHLLFQGKAEMDVLDSGFDELVKQYSEPHRSYHGIHHVYACLNAFDEIQAEISNPFCVETALWFHDVIYDPRKKNNEIKSAKYAKNFLKRTHVTTQDISYIEHLIVLTKHPSKPLLKDEKYLIDIDLMILGADIESYNRYEKEIRAEYSFVPYFLYRKARKNVLNAFLQKENIFETPYFNQRLGQRARENLTRALSS